MRTLTLALLLAACGSSDDGPAIYDCDELSKTVTQRRGECRLPYDQDAVFMDGCPRAMDAYCVPDGLSSSCPSGWSRNCELEPGTGREINCTYGDSSTCTVLVPNETVSFAYVQNLNGIDGLSVLVDGSAFPGRCEFRPCNQL